MVACSRICQADHSASGSRDSDHMVSSTATARLTRSPVLGSLVCHSYDVVVCWHCERSAIGSSRGRSAVAIRVAIREVRPRSRRTWVDPPGVVFRKHKR